MKLISFFYYKLYVFMLCFCTSLLSGVHDLDDRCILGYSCVNSRVIGMPQYKSSINIYLYRNYIIQHETIIGAHDDIILSRLPMVVVGNHCKQLFWLSKASEVGEIENGISKFSFILPDDVNSFKLFILDKGVNKWFNISTSIDRHHYYNSVSPFIFDKSQLELELDYDGILYEDVNVTMNPALMFNKLSQHGEVDISNLEILKRYEWSSKLKVTLTCEGSLADDSACVVVSFLPKSHYDLTLCTKPSVKVGEIDAVCSNSSVIPLEGIFLKFSYCNKKVKKLVKLQYSIHEEFENKDKFTATEISLEATKTKHTAKRVVGEWLYYGDGYDWDRLFEKAVDMLVCYIKSGELAEGLNIIEWSVQLRAAIACIRLNPMAHKFGIQRNECDIGNVFLTPLRYSAIAYGYALPRALNIPYDGKYFVNLQSDCGYYWFRMSQHILPSAFRYGLVQGYIKNKAVPLTQYVFCPLTKGGMSAVNKRCFGSYESDYIGDNNESAIWLHTNRNQSKKVLEHIAELVDKAIAGDLSVIPRIHWWYVHLAPDWRGSGGIAEILTNTLCRLHNVNLPAWADGVAPSVETLLEPNEEKYCSNYHLLFEEDQDKLQSLFMSPTSHIKNSTHPTGIIKDETHFESVIPDKENLSESINAQMSTLNI